MINFETIITSKVSIYNHLTKISQLLEKYGEDPIIKIEIMPSQMTESGMLSEPDCEFLIHHAIDLDAHLDHPDLLLAIARIATNFSRSLSEIPDEFFEISSEEGQDHRPNMFITPECIFMSNQDCSEEFHQSHFRNLVLHTKQFPLDLVLTSKPSSTDLAKLSAIAAKRLPQFYKIYEQNV